MKNDVSYTDLMLIEKMLSLQAAIVSNAMSEHRVYGEPSEMFVNCINAYQEIQKLHNTFVKSGETHD